MVSQKLLLLISALLSFIHLSISTNLISKYESSQVYIDRIIGDFQNSQKNWNTTKINIVDRNWNNSQQSLNLKNLSCSSDTLSVYGLKGILHHNTINEIRIQIRQRTAYNFSEFERNY